MWAGHEPSTVLYVPPARRGFYRADHVPGWLGWQAMLGAKKIGTSQKYQLGTSLLVSAGDYLGCWQISINKPKLRKVSQSEGLAWSATVKL